MRYKLFGRSGLRVSEVCLGTMTFGDAWGGDWGASKNESERIFHAFVDAGGNFIDTANGYTNGQSEELVGEFIAPIRERIVLATKYGFNTEQGNPNAGGNHRKNLMQALDASLRRLKTNYIDLYWVHLWDFTTPVEEVMRALDDQVRAGKILHVGVSNTPAWIVAQANTIAALRGWEPFAGLQIEYNLVERSAEREFLPMSRMMDLGVAAWSPLASGLLTGKYLADGTATSTRAQLATRYKNERAEEIVRQVLAIAEEWGVTPAQVALAWIAEQGYNIFPIIGARSFEQYQQNIAFLNVRLHEPDLERLNSVSSIELGYPHQFLADVFSGKMPGGVWGVPNEQMVLPPALQSTL
jgi:aryl-alcohol dehydrogenase-like predicted oxidoreductase